jgi:hypothetical protein
MSLPISDYECDADELLLMPIIIPQFDLQAEFLDVSSEDSEGEETGKDITGTDIDSFISALIMTILCFILICRTYCIQILREYLYFQN